MILKSRTTYFLVWISVCAALWLYLERREIVARYWSYQENDIQVGAAAEKTAELNQELSDTQERVKNLHTNPLEMESVIRRAKGLVRPGEIVYRIMEDNSVITMVQDNPSAEAKSEVPQESALEAINPEMD